MPTEATFRFSTYLTLALACATIGYAQSTLLPEVAGFAGLAVVALGVLYFLESRVAMLSIPAANRLGAAIGSGFLLWAAYRVKRELDGGEFANMGWPMLVVAMCGPLVLLLLVAKSARGDKHAGDYWMLHGTALAGVGLAAGFAERPLCFVLVGLYLVAAVWSLTLFHLGRAAGDVPPVPDPKAAAPRTAATAAEVRGTRSGFRPALVWAVGAGALAVPLYLLTPRSGAAKAEFGNPRVEIGYAADQMVNLNQTGVLQTNTETAFEVTATHPDGAPKLDLSPGQRWRGRALAKYVKGEWKDFPRLPTVALIARPITPWVPPALGPGQFTLAFEVPAKSPSLFVADPVVWVPREPPPLAGTRDGAPLGWMCSPDGTFFWEPERGERGRPRRYRQEYAAGPDPDLGPGFGLAGAPDDALRHNPVPRVKEYADALLAELIRSGALPAAWRDPAVLIDPRLHLPREEHHDLIARAFARHLATDPGLRYTTDLRREQPGVDPIEDFLFHSKAGHCERFTTALVLMLRAQGIPAVFVLGFKGCEHQGDGRYIVKQEHAHAWVEALVSVPVPEAERRPNAPARRWHWRSLDPTPGGDATPEPGGLWDEAGARLGAWFRAYVMNYTPEQRRKELAAFVARATRTETLLAVVVLVALVLGVRTARRRRARRLNDPPPPAPLTRWFGKLIAVLAAHGIAPAPGETPMEFALRAADALRERPGCEPVAAVPVAWAGAYYQDRFGGAPPTDDRRAELERELDALRRALDTGGLS